MEWHSRLLAESSPKNSFFPMMDDSSYKKQSVPHYKRDKRPLNYSMNNQNGHKESKTHFPFGIFNAGMDFVGKMAEVGLGLGFNGCYINPCANIQNQNKVAPISQVKHESNRSVGSNFVNFIVGGFVGSKSQMHMGGREYSLNLQYTDEWNNFQQGSLSEHMALNLQCHPANFIHLQPFSQEYGLCPPEMNMYSLVSYDQSRIFMAPQVVLPFNKLPQTAFQYVAYPPCKHIETRITKAPSVQAHPMLPKVKASSHSRGHASAGTFNKYQCNSIVGSPHHIQLSTNCPSVPPAPPVFKVNDNVVNHSKQSYADVTKIIPPVKPPASVDHPMKFPPRRTRWKNNKSNNPYSERVRKKKDCGAQHGNSKEWDWCQKKQNNERKSLDSQKKKQKATSVKQLGPTGNNFYSRNTRASKEKCVSDINKSLQPHFMKSSIKCEVIADTKGISQNVALDNGDYGSDHQSVKKPSEVKTDRKVESVRVSSSVDSQIHIVPQGNGISENLSATRSFSDNDDKTSLTRCRLFSCESDSGSSGVSRIRCLSECSVDSEDSLVIFQDGCCLHDEENDSVLSSFSELSDQDSVDEVDFVCPKSRNACSSEGDVYPLEYSSDDDDSDYVSVPTGSSSPFVSAGEDCLKIKEHLSAQGLEGQISGKKKKKVSFAEGHELATVHPIIAWNFAYRAARPGPWEAYARDRDRFKQRIERCNEVIAPVLCDEHRDKVWKRMCRDKKNVGCCS